MMKHESYFNKSLITDRNCVGKKDRLDRIFKINNRQFKSWISMVVNKLKLKGKKVLVTGADGFIGSHLVESCLEYGC